ncbi:MAG TPA: CAP domain-containing protein [Edaphobacter sp.]|nr:CAP domain-containing protein [Edaphobacter sp.]
MRHVNQLPRIVLKATLVLLSVALAIPVQVKAQTASVAEQYLLAAANQERAARGLPELHRDPVLAKAAAFHATQMADHGDIAHEFPGEPSLTTRGATAGVRFSLIAENVAEAPDSVLIHDMWMHSEGHRANLLDPRVNVVGISVIVRDQQLYAVEDFASTVQTLSLNQQEQTVASVIAQSGMKVDDSTEDARETCTMTTGHAGARQPWYIMRYTASSLTDLPSQLRTRLSSGRYRQAVVGACAVPSRGPFTDYNIAVLLYP